MSDFRPSPALLAAVTEALAILKRHWGAQMRLALDITTEGREYTADYCRALAGTSPKFIMAAAERWISLDEKFAPKPGELAKLARQLERQDTNGDSAPIAPAYTGPQRPQFTPDQQRANKVMQGIHRQFNSWMLAGETWEVMLRMARHPDQRLSFEAGVIPPHVVDEAVAIVRKRHGLPEAA